MRKRLTLLTLIAALVVGGGLAVAGAGTTDTEPYRAQPVKLSAKQLAALTVEERTKIGADDPARRYAENTGLIPLAEMYEGEVCVGYVLESQIRQWRDQERSSIEVVTAQRTVIGVWEDPTDPATRPSRAEAVAASERDGSL